METLFSSICDNSLLLHTTLKEEVRRANKQAAEVHSSEGDIVAFVYADVGEEINTRNIGPFLQKL